MILGSPESFQLVTFNEIDTFLQLNQNVTTDCQLIYIDTCFDRV